jgi:hypothetical protein
LARPDRTDLVGLGPQVFALGRKVNIAEQPRVIARARPRYSTGTVLVGDEACCLDTKPKTSAPFLGVNKNKDVREVRTFSQSEADAYYDAAAQLRRYERDIFPYATLLQNYRELVETQKEYAKPTNQALFSSMRSGSQIALHLNRLIMNYLASFRAFLDHAETRFSRTFGRDSAEFRDLKATMALHYDGSFSYPFVYKLRHYAQHCGLPMGNLEAHATEDPPGSSNVRHQISVSFVRDQLLAGFDDWGRVKDQIAAKPEQWDISDDLGYAMTACTDVQATIFRLTVGPVIEPARLIESLRKEVPDSDAFVFVGTIEPSGDKTWQLRVNELPTHIAEMVLIEHAELRNQ